MDTTVELYTDGAFRFSMKPGYGWVAKVADSIIGEGFGSCRNDGTNNTAAEIVAALEALRFAFGRGFRRVVLHTDFESLPIHFRRGSALPNRHSTTARQWLEEHPDIEVTFVKVPSKHPLLNRAHHLSRSGVSSV